MCAQNNVAVNFLKAAKLEGAVHNTAVGRHQHIARAALGQMANKFTVIIDRAS